jgi:hypothetical protein
MHNPKFSTTRPRPPLQALGERLSDRLTQTSGPPTDLNVLAAVPEPAG